MIKVSSMRHESKHRTVLGASGPNNINTLYTIAHRFQQSIMSLRYIQYEDSYITYGKKTLDKSFFDVDNCERVRYVLNNVKINDFTFKPNMIIVSELKNEPEFGKITVIYLLDDKIIFEFIPLKTIGFDKHLHGFSVISMEESRKYKEYHHLPNRTPCLLYTTREKELIVITRSVL